MAIFAAGCFWDVEAAFRRIEGVAATEVGYTGGTAPDPAYEQVRSGTTGHVEAVRIAFDSAVVRYDQLLDLFWDIHDPTAPAETSSERSVIFFTSAEQEQRAEASRDRLQASGRYGGRKILTEILPASRFWEAEEHHQQFYEKCGRSYTTTVKYWE
ncbi:MAG: peptide-methionine (S)-S-oxide reductase MsrA [Methanomicrobiales archaeon]|nr:peptide-methionine (S)-S-oxide reductase MsrA [Methanomicrobiales archaeon]